ncbi:MAG: hypothetical protein K1X54_02710 [Flavobacteriales bacterium]|nr:hypothetical protein [Flavobacteriales bacterium]
MMNKAHPNIIFIFVVSMMVMACTIPKTARIKKRADKKKTQAESILWAYGEGIFGSTTIELRKDSTFTENSFGFFVQQYEWGKWKKVNGLYQLEFESQRNENTLCSLEVDTSARIVHMIYHDEYVVQLRLLLFEDQP